MNRLSVKRRLSQYTATPSIKKRLTNSVKSAYLLIHRLLFICAIGSTISWAISLPVQAETPLADQTALLSNATQRLLSLDKHNIELASVSAAVIDTKTGAPLYQKHADMMMPIASITKLMTAMVTLDAKLPLDEKIQFTRAHKLANNNYYSRIRIGSELARKDVIRIALMSSENMAASALGHTYPNGIKAFVNAMNLKAKQLGMQHTYFVDSTGLSAHNVSTASDLAIMVRAAATYPNIIEYSKTPSYTARFSHPKYALRFGNTNALVHRPSWKIDVTKTGYLDEAGRCLVMMTTINGRNTVMIMLNSYGKRTPVGDAGRIKRWLTTGSSGKISSSARHYQRQILQHRLPDQLALQQSGLNNET
ncbi:D-alanyl-D-alanine endopeptidase [Amphritea sp. 1_MG-2023]|uniref:D-alanyl-D-alanine endopeptidase n=1 Tax=Amphritea sp. 1_MG-2023 TaxID=3062670 RepID=UPI0026E1C12E|nr:D-alanyl-D-alanine endopeptidase [Amphritea sp. 1_MG-2023]MDO6562947.1 D-alanyl-D-alanine endopeptidase [Amphritea sp. 1_MG-2023]